MNMRTQLIPAEPILVLLKQTICETDRNGVRCIRPLYLLYRFGEVPSRDWTFKSLKFHFEQHTCPTNLLRQMAGFYLEEKPLCYNDDPHGLYEVCGWITEREAVVQFTIPAGRVGFDAALVQHVLEQFKKPPEPWMAELGITPEQPGDLYRKFVTELSDEVWRRYYNADKTVGDKIRQVIGMEMLGSMANDTAGQTAYIEAIIKMAVLLDVKLSLSSLIDKGSLS